jgi:hypothetical protein
MLEGLICALYALVVKSSQSEGKDRISACHEFEQEIPRIETAAKGLGNA